MAESNRFAHSILKHSSPLLCLYKSDDMHYVGMSPVLTGALSYKRRGKHGDWFCEGIHITVCGFVQQYCCHL